MRRKIEEVNLYVTISEHNNGFTTGKTRPPFASVTDQTLIRNEDEEESDADDMLEEEWLQFAMSETPLTCPHKKNDVGGSFSVPGNQTIPNVQRAIVIREPIIRLASPPREPVIKQRERKSDCNGRGYSCSVSELPSPRDVNQQSNIVKQVFPTATHAACTVHLWRNTKARFKSQRLASPMGAAARAYTVEGFNKVFIAIQRVSPWYAAYLVDIGRREPQKGKGENGCLLG
ncbi:hypothetical protein DY000_02039803 [Brassica cretica]|uniref:MULE transposase domain-containing protein n=1 Tax=Brassica cretica TaxID=69181 RepID=A0ABQ7BL52_BRACR|nr:hypothetical protein DY000_02039803 [Brassica cretica]